MTCSWNSQIPCGNADEETIRSLIVSRNEGGVEPDCELRLGVDCALDRLSWFFIRKWQTISEFSILSSVKDHWRRDEGASKISYIYSWFLRSISSANRRDHDLNEHCSITGTRASAVANGWGQHRQNCNVHRILSPISFTFGQEGAFIYCLEFSLLPSTQP